MVKIYYTIWSDIIRQIKESPKISQELKKRTIIIIYGYISNILGVGFAALMIIIQYHFFNIIPIFYKINYILVDNVSVDRMLKFIILYDIPVFALNYFLVLHKKKYESFIYRYEFYQGKYFFKWFLLFSILASALLMIVAGNTESWI